MKKIIISSFITLFFITSPVKALIIDPHELEILFKEDPSCYLALKRTDDHNIRSLFAFDQSHLSYISTIIQRALLDYKDINIALEKVPLISYQQVGSERLYDTRFLYVNYKNIRQIIHVLE